MKEPLCIVVDDSYVPVAFKKPRGEMDLPVFENAFRARWFAEALATGRFGAFYVDEVRHEHLAEILALWDYITYVTLYPDVCPAANGLTMQKHDFVDWIEQT